MTCLLLAKISFWVNLLAVFFIVICALLILIVLLQKGKGDGLAAAFGGAGGQSAFGSKTGDMFTWITIVMVAIFLTSASILSCVYRPTGYEEQTPRLSAPAQAPPAEQPPADVPGETRTPAESAPDTPTPPAETDGNAGTTAPATPPAPADETTSGQEN